MSAPAGGTRPPRTSVCNVMISHESIVAVNRGRHLAVHGICRLFLFGLRHSTHLHPGIVWACILLLPAALVLLCGPSFLPSALGRFILLRGCRSICCVFPLAWALAAAPRLGSDLLYEAAHYRLAGLKCNIRSATISRGALIQGAFNDSVCLCAYTATLGLSRSLGTMSTCTTGVVVARADGIAAGGVARTEGEGPGMSEGGAVIAMTAESIAGEGYGMVISTEGHLAGDSSLASTGRR